MSETERQRAIRNHMAAHLISQPNLALGNEPCAYCLGSCHAVVSINDAQKRKVVGGGTIATNAKVRPNCQKYGISPFTFKGLKPLTKKYFCTSTLYYCGKCDSFVWTYNLKRHFDAVHKGLPSSLESKLPTNEEKQKLKKAFPIKISASD